MALEASASMVELPEQTTPLPFGGVPAAGTVRTAQPDGSAGAHVHLSAAPAPPAPASYDPAAEDDLLIRDHIELDPWEGEPIFRNKPYPIWVWAVLLNLRASGYDRPRVLRLFSELTPADLDAAQRFWRRYPAELQERLS